MDQWTFESDRYVRGQPVGLCILLLQASSYHRRLRYAPRLKEIMIPAYWNPMITLSSTTLLSATACLLHVLSAYIDEGCSRFRGVSTSFKVSGFMTCFDN